ncbi:uncharacterized protein [Pyrus communis]|uniref:uncharacterized protein isoform X1 n=1 Tax=Pyrus communis TaxID=23211 RepID=UPI0035BEBC16
MHAMFRDPQESWGTYIKGGGAEGITANAVESFGNKPQEDQEVNSKKFLPCAHEVIPRGYSQQRVLKEGIFEDLSLANKQLRFVLRFLMVCLLLNWQEMVRLLLNQLRVLVDECKRTFQPWVMKRETVIGKKNCHQILTEVGRRNLFVPNMRENCGLRRMQSNQFLS